MDFHDSPPPAEDQDLAIWETFFGVTMPEDFKRLLRKSDGPILWDEQHSKELQVLSSAGAVGYYQAYDFPECLPNAIPIAMDGMSNFVVYRVNDGKVCGIAALHSGDLNWDSAVDLCDNLTSLIAMPVSVYDRMKKG